MKQAVEDCAIKPMNNVVRSEFLTRKFMFHDCVFYPHRKAVGDVRRVK